MHSFETWGDHWHYFSGAMFIIMFLMMAICIFIFYRRRGFIFNSRWFRQNGNRSWFSDCYSTRNLESADDILNKRYVRGEINKEEFEQLKRDISDTH
jgi:uncharacterized membrane protein